MEKSCLCQQTNKKERRGKEKNEKKERRKEKRKKRWEGKEGGRGQMDRKYEQKHSMLTYVIKLSFNLPFPALKIIHRN